jgi:hypothetical protein
MFIHCKTRRLFPCSVGARSQSTIRSRPIHKRVTHANRRNLGGREAASGPTSVAARGAVEFPLCSPVSCDSYGERGQALCPAKPLGEGWTSGSRLSRFRIIRDVSSKRKLSLYFLSYLIYGPFDRIAKAFGQSASRSRNPVVRKRRSRATRCVYYGFCDRDANLRLT